MTADQALARRTLPALRSALAHRGPDDDGEDTAPMGDRFLGLAQTRLSIIDLSPAGHQPMIHPDSGDRLIYNGELYNFAALGAELRARGVKFRGHSDTEVLLHALVEWGPACIERLQGMFAFAFHDVSAQRLILARDPVGIKPLYLAALPEGGLVFASEVRAILRTGLCPPRLDPRGLAGLLAYGAVQHPCTIFQGVEDMPPGHYQVVAPGDHSARVGRVRFWKAPPTGSTPSEVVGVVRSTVESAVRDHLVSDVPVGVFLSSGLDSTIVAGIAARHAARLRSFTVGFADAPDTSELAVASRTAARFGLQHTAIDVSGDEALDTTRSWLAALDSPSVDGLNVFLISRFVRAQGIKVALSGQGGDELFGGYPSFRDIPRLRRLFQAGRRIPRALRRKIAALATARRPSAVREKAIDLADSDGSLPALYFRRRKMTATATLRALGLVPGPLGLTDDYIPRETLTPDLIADVDEVGAISRLETAFYMGNMLLRDGDANGMRHGLEIRVPLLDQRLLDLLLGLPGSVRLPSGSRPKHLLALSFPELLSPEQQTAQKRGFTLPIARWLQGPLRELCEAGLGAARTAGPLNPAGVDAAWTGFLRDPRGAAWTLPFTLMVLGLYLRDSGACA